MGERNLEVTDPCTGVSQIITEYEGGLLTLNRPSAHISRSRPQNGPYLHFQYFILLLSNNIHILVRHDLEGVMT